MMVFFYRVYNVIGQSILFSIMMKFTGGNMVGTKSSVVGSHPYLLIAVIHFKRINKIGRYAVAVFIIVPVLDDLVIAGIQFDQSFTAAYPYITGIVVCGIVKELAAK